MKTDADLQADVIAELKWSPAVTATHIGVSAEGGVVTLSGHVPSYLEKVAAECAAKRVHGVRGLADELDVKLPGTSRRTDADVAAACVASLSADGGVPDERVTVIVRDGAVVLEGQVDWSFQRQAAEAAVRRLYGVVEVANQITLAPRASAADVKRGIEDAFRRSAEIDARHVSVASIAGEVVLSGKVGSWTERDAAQEAAWAAPGVVAVDNRIVVEA